MEEKIETFFTNDLQVVSFLRYKGFDPQVQREAGQPTIFLFSKNVELIKSLVRDFKSGSSEEYKLLCFYRDTKAMAIEDYQSGYYKNKGKR